MVINLNITYHEKLKVDDFFVEDTSAIDAIDHYCLEHGWIPYVVKTVDSKTAGAEQATVFVKEKENFGNIVRAWRMDK